MDGDEFHGESFMSCRVRSMDGRTDGDRNSEPCVYCVGSVCVGGEIGL